MSKLKVRDASKSFPSGHASLSVYFFTFTAVSYTTYLVLLLYSLIIKCLYVPISKFCEYKKYRVFMDILHSTKNIRSIISWLIKYKLKSNIINQVQYSSPKLALLRKLTYRWYLSLKVSGNLILLWLFQWYLQQRMASLSALIVAWLQTLLLTWALFCSVTRITDHRHHWWDVLAGSILGAALGIYTVSVFSSSYAIWYQRWVPQWSSIARLTFSFNPYLCLSSLVSMIHPTNVKKISSLWLGLVL